MDMVNELVIFECSHIARAITELILPGFLGIAIVHQNHRVLNGHQAIVGSLP